jgi:hypothetical protein
MKGGGRKIKEGASPLKHPREERGRDFREGLCPS